MQTQQQYKHWRFEIDADKILWLTLDRQDTSVNSLNREVFDEFAAVTEEIPKLNVIGVVLCSGKKKGFIAGADITQFSGLKTEADAFELMQQAHKVLHQFENLKLPTVALISGFCLGGGLEVALACTYRIANLDESSTRIGLPEVLLGIQPGWGGTVRLPKLIGAIQAMKMMLTGRTVNAREASKLGIVDAAVPQRELKRAAKYYILSKPAPHQPKGIARFTNESWARPVLARVFERELIKKKVREEHYPAPYAMIESWLKEGVSDAAYIAEAKSIAKLFMTSTSRNLVRSFFLQERLKSLGKEAKFKGQHIHVIGAGTMGGDIAAWCAYQGFRVTLQDRSPEQIAPAIARAYKLYQKKLKIPRLIQEKMDLLQPDVEGKGVAKADLVIEAIYENLQGKQDLYQKIEPQLKPDAILASNTSSIPLDELNTVLQDPSRLVGIHFFNPVAQMMLVEVVVGEQTRTDIVKLAQSFVGKLNKLPVPVASTPGFLVNRILMPYLLEALFLFEEGVSPQDIDKAALDFGMRMGPIELADTIGLDVLLSVAKNLVSEETAKIVTRLQSMVAQGHLGVKSGQGFYHYKKGKLEQSNLESSKVIPIDLQERLINVMLNEAVTCLNEKVVADADLLDAAMIFATGFAPFRGGPMNYIKTVGASKIVDQLNRLATNYGDRFTPASAWKKWMANGEGEDTASMYVEAGFESRT